MSDGGGAPRRVLVVAGEASGDAHAARLVERAREIAPGTTFVGMGGPKMRRAGVDTLVDSAEVAVVGVFEVLAHLGAIVRAFLRLARSVREEPPDLAILVDFPDFNFLFARVLRRAGVPVAYYVSPQVWAWRSGRVRTLRKLVRRMLVLFPFEERFFAEAGLDVAFVGHPLADEPPPAETRDETRARLGLREGERVVALLPGSRRGEVGRMLPLLVASAAALAAKRPDLRFVLPLAPTLTSADLAPHLAGSAVPIDVVQGGLAELLAASDLAVVASGTATLDCARATVPMVVVYRVTWLTYLLARLLVRDIDHFAMPNILAGRRVVPELLQGEFTAERVAAEGGALLDDPVLAARTRTALADVRASLGAPGASERAARLALEVAGRTPPPTTTWLARRLWPYVHRHRGALAIAVVCMLVGAGLAAAPAALLKYALDDVLIGRKAEMLYVLPVAVIAIFALRGVADFGETFLMNRMARRMIADLRAEVFRKLASQSLGFYHRNPTGTLLSRVTFDVQLVQTATVRSVVAAGREAGTVVVLTLAAFYLNWQLSVIGLVVFPLAIFPILNFGKRVRKASRRSQETMGDLSSHVHEMATGIRVVKAFRLEDAMWRRFERENERLYALAMRMVRVQALSSPIVELLAAFGIAGVLLFGGHQVIHGGQTAGQFAGFIYVLLSLYKPVKDLSKLNATVQEGLAAAERIFQVLDEDPAVRDRPAARTLGRVRGAVAFEDVRFGYGGDVPVLDGFSLEVAPGTVVALVGPSGSGKSTIVNLVARFYDVEAGAVRIDGHDVRDVTLASLRDQIALVDQQTFLFNDTVRANIAYGRPGATDAEIEAAARAAHADGFVGELPLGYDTVIGEQGLRLSGGQRQRISIARALLKDPPILILDEATSSLDTASEREVQAALAVLLRERTTFVIAHRLSTIQHAHRILVLEGGRIVEQGTHEELVARSGVYAALQRSAELLAETA